MVHTLPAGPDHPGQRARPCPGTFVPPATAVVGWVTALTRLVRRQHERYVKQRRPVVTHGDVDGASGNGHEHGADGDDSRGSTTHEQ
ncbi:hypothetical protein GCM10009772_55000 [Pseudonocardia alni subsp. carboxydivorans]